MKVFFNQKLPSAIGRFLLRRNTKRIQRTPVIEVKWVDHGVCEMRCYGKRVAIVYHTALGYESNGTTFDTMSESISDVLVRTLAAG
jgi:hypothetical protein